MSFSQRIDGKFRQRYLIAPPLAALLALASGCTEVNVPEGLVTVEGPAAGTDVATATPPPTVATPAATPPTGTDPPPTGTDPPPTGTAPPPATVPPATVTDPLVPVGIDIAQDQMSYPELVEEVLGGFPEAIVGGHLSLVAWAAQPGGLTEPQIEALFAFGDELSEVQFTVSDGVGALLDGQGVALSRFNRGPQGDRFTGPNAQACITCHDQPLGNGAGLAALNVAQNPSAALSGQFDPIVNFRNSRNVNGSGWLQQIAIEMTEEIQAQAAMARATPGTAVDLTSKGTSFGSLTCTAAGGGGGGGVQCDYSTIEGISPDLIVRPFGWKGFIPTLRIFNQEAFAGELGLPSDQLAFGAGALPPDLNAVDIPDVDGDGVGREISVGDVTALTFYFATQRPPTTLVELATRGADFGVALDGALDMTSITAGEALFNGAAMCSNCHTSVMPVADSVFRDPDMRAGGLFADQGLLGTNGYLADNPVQIDLAREAPADAVEAVPETTTVFGVPGAYEAAILSDLKRHTMGLHLCDAEAQFALTASESPITVPADSADPALPVLIDTCQFLTPPLWGIGGTAPYMHDGRATTIFDAIMAHCSQGADPANEADASCQAFVAMDEVAQDQLIAFLVQQIFVPEPG